jgi:hypothetical protein
MPLRKMTYLLLAILLSGCIGNDQDAFYVQNAQFRTSIKELKLFHGNNEFLITQHRIKKGAGGIIAIRHFTSGNWFMSDDESYMKLTLHFPKFLEESETHKTFHEGEFVGFYSAGPSAFPDNGVYGLVEKGSIEVEKIDGDFLKVVLNIEFRVADLITADKRNELVNLNNSYMLKNRSIQNITPWEGREGASQYDESYR